MPIEQGLTWCSSRPQSIRYDDFAVLIAGDGHRKSPSMASIDVTSGKSG